MSNELTKKCAPLDLMRHMKVFKISMPSEINLHKIQSVLKNKQQIQELARRQEEIDLFRPVILVCQEQTEQLNLFLHWNHEWSSNKLVQYT